MKNNCTVKQAFFQRMVFENPVSLNMRLRMQPRFVTADKMAGIFTKHIRHSRHNRTDNGFFKLVEPLLLSHSCFFSQSTNVRGLPLSAVTVSLHCLTAFNSHIRKSSIGCFAFVREGFTFVQGGLIFEFVKNSTNLECFIFQFGGIGAFFGGVSPPNPP